MILIFIKIASFLFSRIILTIKIKKSFRSFLSNSLQESIPNTILSVKISCLSTYYLMYHFSYKILTYLLYFHEIN